MKAGKNKSLYLVLPKEPNQYGFGYCSRGDMEEFYKQRIPIENLSFIASLWENYQAGNLAELNIIAEKLEHRFPFIKAAVKAHIDRVPGDEENGLPYKTLISIIKEHGSNDFMTIFKEFNKRLPIYGFGDLQVERMLSKIKKMSIN